MTFEWDPVKSDANLTDRGFDFEFATQVFEGPTLEVEDRRQDYGEVRVAAIGLAQGIVLTIIYTDRQDEAADLVRRIISARRSNHREREAYRTAIQGPTRPRARGSGTRAEDDGEAD